MTFADDLKRELPLATLLGVTSGLVCRVELTEHRDDADFATMHGHSFRVLKSFPLSESELRVAWDRLLNCQLTRPYSPNKAVADLAIQLFSNGEWVGAAEVKWANNSVLLLIDDQICVPIFDASSPDAHKVRRDFDERLS